jgi:3-dehydroquinate dehydratase-2
VHLSDIGAREEFRRHSVISDLCVATVSGQGPEGYREGLARLKKELGG